MATKTPTQTLGNPNVVRHDGIWGGAFANTGTYQANGIRFSPTAAAAANQLHRGDLALIIEYFGDIDTTDTWTSDWGADLVAVAWQSGDPNETNPMNANVTADGVVTWTGPSGADSTGWLWCLVKAGSDVAKER